MARESVAEMTAERSAKQRDASRFAAQAANGRASLAALLAAQPALAQSPFNPYGSFTDSGPVTPEEKARREQVRTDLYDRLSPAYRIDVPFVSEASIAALAASHRALSPDRGRRRLARHRRRK